MVRFPITMTSSPFHGIFSALGSGSSRDDSSWADTEEKDGEMPVPAGKNASARPQDGMGRVAVDVYEQDGYYIIKAPIAGVRLSDLDIEVHDAVVTIRGCRRQSDAVAGDQYYVQECFFGPFSRSVTLPFPVDPKKVKATFNRECILKIFIPKEEKVKIVRIQET